MILQKSDFENMKGEIMVFIKAFDDIFSNIVVASIILYFQ